MKKLASAKKREVSKNFPLGPKKTNKFTMIFFPEDNLLVFFALIRRHSLITTYILAGIDYSALLSGTSFSILHLVRPIQ